MFPCKFVHIFKRASTSPTPFPSQLEISHSTETNTIRIKSTRQITKPRAQLNMKRLLDAPALLVLLACFLFSSSKCSHRLAVTFQVCYFNNDFYCGYINVIQFLIRPTFFSFTKCNQKLQKILAENKSLNTRTHTMRANRCLSVVCNYLSI